jgi:hypothetical protein
MKAHQPFGFLAHSLPSLQPPLKGRRRIVRRGLRCRELAVAHFAFESAGNNDACARSHWNGEGQPQGDGDLQIP